MKTDTKFAFIVGHPRSGSTLLSTRLAQHRDIHATPETHFMDLSANGNWLLKWGARRSPEAFVRFLHDRNPRLNDLAMSGDTIEACLQAGFPHFKAAFQQLLAKEAEMAGCLVVLEKTPRHLEYLDQITQWFPNAPIIVILRDGRDAVESLCTVDWVHDNPIRHAAHWAENVQSAFAAKRRWPGRVHIVRYEDLLTDPETTLRTICTLIGVEFAQETIDSAAKASSIPEWESGWKAQSNQPIDTSFKQKWRRSSNPKRVARIEALLAPELSKLGYELSPSTPRASLRGRITFKIIRARYRAAVLAKRYFDMDAGRQPQP